MAKQKKKLLQIQDFFGAYNTYRIFALKSDLSHYNFANRLGKTLNVSFSALPDFDYASDKFAVFYAQFPQNEPVHCLLLENRIETNQQELFKSNAKTKSNLLNYSLFKEPFYLFNNKGLHRYKIEFPDMDYLLLLFAKKNIENEIFQQFLSNLTLFKVKDVSNLLEKKHTKLEKETLSFLRDFYCSYEVSAHQFLRRKKKELLHPVQQIPKQNLQFPIPIILENDTLSDTLQLSNEYLKLLDED